MWPEDSNMRNIAKSFLPRDYWNSFCNLSWNETKIIELTEDLFIQLVKKGSNVSAVLRLKMIGSTPLTIAEWL
jgi:hypothetical protein